MSLDSPVYALEVQTGDCFVWAVELDDLASESVRLLRVFERVPGGPASVLTVEVPASVIRAAVGLLVAAKRSPK